MGLDFSFDRRIAAQYEEQRRHPPAVSAAVGEAIVDLVGEGATVLELGIGTGRIARPAASAGCRVVGVDLSEEMLHEARREQSPGAAVDLVQADIQHLPFTRGSFDAVMAVHVLHLVSDLHGTLAESVYTLRPEGYFVQGRDWVDPQSPTGLLRDGMRRRVMELAPASKPPAAGGAVEEMLAELGGRPDEAQEMMVAEWEFQVTPASILEAMANRTHSESWVLPDELLQPVLEYLNDLAVATWTQLDNPQPVRRRFYMKAIPGHWKPA